MSRRDSRTDAAREYRRLYKTARWSGLRQWQLDRQPLCERCLALEIVEEAGVVHHRDKHDGDEARFWDPDNLESLCKAHHDSEGQREDLGQKIVQFGPDGWPIDD